MDIYYIDSNYDEQIYNITTIPNDFTRLNFNIRCVNKIVKISGSASATITIRFEPVEIYPSGNNFYYAQISQGRSFFPLYMVPRGKKVRVSSIDYYRNTSTATLSLLKWNKTSNADSAEEPAVVYQFIVDGILTADFESEKYFTEGEVLGWFNSNTTSTSNTINATYEIYKI